jgi:flagellar biosynthesis/type III secretory pathway protein FliH
MPEPLMQDDVVELVARAIYAEWPTVMFYERPGSPPGNQYLNWEHAPDGCKERSRRQARAAIAAHDLAVGEREREAFDQGHAAGFREGARQALKGE